MVFTWEKWNCVEWDAYSGFVNVGGRRRDALRAIANATLTMRSFEIQLKGVPSITGRRTPAPAPAASIKDRHGIYETAYPADAALSANVKSISAINNSKLRRSWEFALSDVLSFIIKSSRNRTRFLNRFVGSHMFVFLDEKMAR